MGSAPVVDVDEDEIQRAVAVLVAPGTVVELRALGGRVASGYFADCGQLVQAAANLSGKVSGVYVTLNSVNPDLLARAQNRVRDRLGPGESTTSDVDVVARRWFLIDCDPVRPSGISATDAEHDAALGRARIIRDALMAEGWPAGALLLANSGNGAHLLARVDLPNDREATALLERCLEALHCRFSDAGVTVDRKTANAARIGRVYGTLAAKGDATVERPHRLARILEMPTDGVIVPTACLERLAAIVPPRDHGARGSEGHGPGIDLRAWLETHGLTIATEKPLADGTLFTLDPCPWNPAHVNRSAFAIQFTSGAIVAKCFHDGCHGKDWHALRDAVEPGWQAQRAHGAHAETDGDGADQQQQQHRRASTPWGAAVGAPEFLNVEEQEIAWLEEHLLAPGSVTEWFSPRGLGKTHVALALAVQIAQRGHRVLLVDRDNSRREVRRRLRAWGAADAPTLKVMTRDDVPPLTDTAAWKTFPFQEYELVIVDSLDESTEGVGEQDSSKPSRAVAPILDIAHRANGPAILVLGNTVKSDAHGRGSGVVEDRADIVYEIRDATGFVPSTRRPWWTELPVAGRGTWADRASRRRRQDRYRLAFVPSKFRIGEEPEPFILEIDLAEVPWLLRAVTAEVLEAGRTMAAETARAQEAQLNALTAYLVDQIAGREAGGLRLTKTQAVSLLCNKGLTRKAARALIEAGDGTSWTIEVLLDQKGRPQVLRPRPSATASASPPEDPPNPATTAESPSYFEGGANNASTGKPASGAGLREGVFPPSAALADGNNIGPHKPTTGAGLRDPLFPPKKSAASTSSGPRERFEI